MQRNLFVDYAKGILILLVVVGHAIQLVVLQNDRCWNDPLFELVYMFHMPLFMALSGYVSHRGLQRDSLRSIFVGKSAAYILPIYSWTILQMPAVFLHERGNVPWVAWPSIIFWTSLNFLWFLWTLLACIFFTAAIRRTGRYFWPLSAVVFAGLLTLPDVGTVKMLKFMYPYFMAGYFVASVKEISLSRTQRILITLISGLFTAWSLAIWRKDYYVYTTGMLLTGGNATNVVVRYVVGFGVSIFAILLMYACYKATAGSLRQWFVLLGRNSLYIYVIQFSIFPFLSKLMRNVFVNSASASFVSSSEALAIGVLVTLLCWLVGSLLSRNELAAFLLFGRRRSIPLNVPTA